MSERQKTSVGAGKEANAKEENEGLAIGTEKKGPRTRAAKTPTDCIF